MASRMQYQGDAAIHAAISALLLRGYNSGRPIYDEADSDDFWVRGPKGNVLRCQARSVAIRNWKKVRVGKVWQESKWSKSDNVQFPESILTDGVDLVIMCILHRGRFLVGLFDSDDVRTLREEGRGGFTNRRDKAGVVSPRPTIGFKWSLDMRCDDPQIFFSGMRNVTAHFDQQGGKWQELFPVRWV